MLTRRHFLLHSSLASAALASQPLSSLTAEGLAPASTDALPDAYFRRMAQWCPLLLQALDDQPNARLSDLETRKGWYHFPFAILPAAVLYKRANPANPFQGKAAMLDLAVKIGDLLVREDAAGTFSPRLDSYRDAYMWLEAYRLLQGDLDAKRRSEWAAVLARNAALLVPDLEAWKDVAAYTEDFLGTSPNHFAWWSATVLTAGIFLDKPDWARLGAYVLHRFAATEQNPDGYWGEHNPDAPTCGYNYLTTMAVGVYWERTHAPEALEALRRATRFHSHITYANGMLMELFNDRNRYWEVSPWGQFAFSHFPEGRAYAQLLTRNIPDDKMDIDTLGLLGQDALYFHEGPSTPCPAEQPSYVYRLTAPAGVRKTGPWTVALSGIVDTPIPKSQWFLDRQANVSLFHEAAGLIIDGANSRRQPQLATFSEKTADGWEMMPRGGRLMQSPGGDTVAVAHNSFSAEIFAPPASPRAAELHFRINGRGPAPQEAWLGLQLCLKPGEQLTAGSGQVVTIGSKPIDWDSKTIAGKLRHGLWTLHVDHDAQLQWPVYPYNPYRNRPETDPRFAVALLRLPLNLHADPAHWLQINEKLIHLRITVA